jgi:hypothetical protein
MDKQTRHMKKVKHPTTETRCAVELMPKTPHTNNENESFARNDTLILATLAPELFLLSPEVHFRLGVFGRPDTIIPVRQRN